MHNALHVDHKEQRIRETAYHLWERDGRPAGQAERHWEMARRMTEDAEMQSASAARAAAGRPAPVQAGPYRLRVARCR